MTRLDFDTTSDKRYIIIPHNVIASQEYLKITNLPTSKGIRIRVTLNEIARVSRKGNSETVKRKDRKT
jgi:hypothetical protein